MFFLKLLLRNLPAEQTQLASCDEYFSLLTGLLKLCTPPELAELVAPTELFATAVQRLRARDIYESNDEEQPADKVLGGFLRLLHTLVDIAPELRVGAQGLIADMFGFAFDLPAEGGPGGALPKFKKKETRKRAFQLLNQLCKGDADNFEELLLLLTTRQHHEYETVSKASGGAGDEYSVPLRASGAYAGLRNFGCTCYINSLLQQLYMIPEIRRGFLAHKQVAADDPRAAELGLVASLQEIFANLLLSEKAYTSPEKLVELFRFHGQQIDRAQQQDADEFFALLEDQLGRHSPRVKALFAGELGSSLVNSITSLEEEYPYTSRREEDSLRISLEIKNKQSIAEALDFFVKGDVLEGDNKYHCEEHDRKVRAVKRCCLGRLGNTVAIHLKRFEFDMTTMLRYKVNDYCEFPLRLDLHPWTEQGLRDKARQQPEGQSPPPAQEEAEVEAEEGAEVEVEAEAEADADAQAEVEPGQSDCLFDLAGVLIHSGGSEAGHYYSFIRERGTQQWFEFNDTQVKPFDLANHSRAWFGGELEQGDPGYGSLYAELFGSEKAGGKAMRSNNAYLLFYERVERKEPPPPPGPVPGAVPPLDASPEDLEEAEKRRRAWLEDATPLLVKGVPQRLYERITEQTT